MVAQWNRGHLCRARMQVRSQAQHSALTDLALLQLWHRTHLHLGSDPSLGELHLPRGSEKSREKGKDLPCPTIPCLSYTLQN